MNSKIETRTLGDRLTDLSASKISDIFAVSPVDLKDSHLHALLAKGYFGTPFDEPLPGYDTKSVPEYFESKPLPKRIRKKTPPYDPKLAVIAFLITRQLVTEDLVETYLPEIPYREFHRYQSKIHREIETTFPERFKRFEKYWDSLTTPQKQALRQVHMAQDRASTYPEAAKALGITTNALKERLKAATAKLKAFYPDLRAIQDEPKRPVPGSPAITTSENVSSRPRENAATGNKARPGDEGAARNFQAPSHQDPHAGPESSGKDRRMGARPL